MAAQTASGNGLVIRGVSATRVMVILKSNVVSAGSTAPEIGAAYRRTVLATEAELRGACERFCAQVFGLVQAAHRLLVQDKVLKQGMV